MFKTIIRSILLVGTAIAGFALAPSSDAQATRQAEVIWGAAATNSVATAEGFDLPVGDLALLGSFDLTPSKIQADASNVNLLQANFVPYAAAQIGNGNPAGTSPPAPGFWLTDTKASTDNVTVGNKIFNIAHTQIYYWIFNARTVATATEQGIFTAPGNPNWVFPADNDLINITTTDISDVPPTSQGILVGSFGVSDSSLTGFPQYNLAPIITVPEPTSQQLLLVAASIGLSLKFLSWLKTKPRFGVGILGLLEGACRHVGMSRVACRVSRVGVAACRHVGVAGAVSAPRAHGCSAVFVSPANPRSSHQGVTRATLTTPGPRGANEQRSQLQQEAPSPLDVPYQEHADTAPPLADTPVRSPNVR